MGEISACNKLTRNICQIIARSLRISLTLGEGGMQNRKDILPPFQLHARGSGKKGREKCFSLRSARIYMRATKNETINRCMKGGRRSDLGKSLKSLWRQT